MRTMIKALGVAAVAGLILSSCTTSDEPEDAQVKDSEAQQQNYNTLQGLSPAHQVTYPMSRNLVNFWVDTWNKPGALSYNYIESFDQNGALHVAGYYILEGVPMSYCTALTPPYKIVDAGGEGEDIKMAVQAPGIDGVFYGNTDCKRYYGKDALTGQYIEYTVPMNAFIRTTNEPIDNVTAPALGPSTVEEVKKASPSELPDKDAPTTEDLVEESPTPSSGLE